MLHRKFFDWKNIGRFHIGKQSRVGHRRRRGVQAPLQTEILEDRTLLTNFLVDTLDDVVADDDMISLREAIASANLNAAPNDDLAAGEDDGDTISFAAAIAGGTILLDMSLGQLEITDDLDIDGSDPNMLASDITISGQNAIRILQINTTTDVGSRTAVSLSNLILTAGNTAGSPGDDGGAIRIADGEDVTLDSLSITNSHAATNGGGIWMSAGMLTIDGSTIDGNTANGKGAENGGGGIFNNGGTLTIGSRSGVTLSNNSALGDSASGGGIFNSGGTLSVNESEIVNNSAEGVRGGGLLHSGGAIGTISNSLIQGNSASASGLPTAGGLSNADSTLTLNQVDVLNNSSGGISNSGTAATLTINGGNISENMGFRGGGIANSRGTIEIQGTMIRNNTSFIFGGGIFNSDGTMNVEDSSIDENVVDGSSFFHGGGAVHNSGGTFTALNTTFIGNRSSHQKGGLFNNHLMTLTNVTISGNTAGTEGGGFFTLLGRTEIRDSLISNNHAVSGGGVFVDDPSGRSLRVILINTRVTGNTADEEGGGISNTLGSLFVINSTVDSNNADRGGGIANSRNLTLVNSTISGNSATGNGGGIFSDGSSLLITNSTVANNQAASGGGIYGGPLTMNSTIIASNLAEGISNDLENAFVISEPSGPFRSGLFNLIGASVGSNGIEDGVNNNQVGTPSNPIDARLGTLAANGGPTPTHALLPNSPAIDRGLAPEYVPIPVEGDFLSFDQRGEPFLREFGNQLDIGAFERQAMDIERNEILVTATGPGADGIVEVSNAITHDQLFSIEPYPGFTGGVRVATGDVNGDGTMDIITGAGPEGGPHVKVFDGKDGTSELFSFFAYDATFTGGIFVAAADLNGDDVADIITGAGEGGGPHVKAFSGVDGSVLFSFMAYNAQPGTGFTGGVRVAAGDVTGDGVPDIITGAGPGGGPHVRVFDGATPVTHGGETNDIGGAIGSYFAYQSTPLFKGGIFVSAGEFDGLPGMEIVTAAGTGGGPHIRIASPGTFTGTNFLADFMAYDISYGGGVSVATIDWNDDGNPDILAGQLQGSNAEVRVFDGTDDLTVFYPTPLDSLTPLSEQTPPLVGGVYVAGEAATGTGLGSPLMAAQTAQVVNDDLVPLTQDQLTQIAQAILERAEWSGLNAQQQQTLADATFLVRDLPGDLLGLTRRGQIVLDVDAAGHGWFIDPTPGMDEEFGRITEWGKPSDDPEISQQLDLLTVVSHEFAHLLGAEDRQGDSWTLMAPTLNVGTRKLFDQGLLDELFTGSDLADALLGS